MNFSCLICLHPFDARSEISSTHCGQVFHSACIVNWFASNYYSYNCICCNRFNIHRIYLKPDVLNQSIGEHEDKNTKLIAEMEKKNQTLEHEYQSLGEREDKNTKLIAELEKKNQTLESELEEMNQGLIEYQLIGDREDKSTKLIAELEKSNQNLERQNQILENELEEMNQG